MTGSWKNNARDKRYARDRSARTSGEAARKRKVSDYLGLESHFHADHNCQTRQLGNYKSDQWQVSNQVLNSFPVNQESIL